MKAYITHWAGGHRRIGLANIGGATEVELTDAEYARLRDCQDKADTLQKDLMALSRVNL